MHNRVADCLCFSLIFLQTDSMLLPEIGAVVSVLLGFTPSVTLSAASSSKLNKVLVPNPFDRPRSVLMLEVRGTEDYQLKLDSEDDIFSRALSRKVVYGENTADLQLPDEDEVSVVLLNEPLNFDSDAECTDKELSEFASWLGGSYVTSLEQLNGLLTIPLANGAHLNLQMSKKADREFTASLVSLIRNIQRAMVMHQELSGSMRNPAELITGKFDGIKVLQEQYGSVGVAQQGAELLFTSISKIFDSLQEAYNGQIVGVIFSMGTPPSGSETMLNVMITSRSTPRWLEETTGSSNPILVAEVLLVRRTLAWITGIILLIATLFGVYFLMNMPLTKDTLLYSNVKFD
ncbi:unnamed protein product [Ilex paraguariensis]|uniref:DUF7794 domain-containing protein n=1 Tax=Ilex paraguariensis TaxID=185542 RepID=A0ABC8TWD9_9AQUA